MVAIQSSIAGSICMQTMAGELFVWSGSHRWECRGYQDYFCKPSKAGHVLACRSKEGKMKFVTESDVTELRLPWVPTEFFWAEEGLVARVEGDSKVYLIPYPPK